MGMRDHQWLLYRDYFRFAPSAGGGKDKAFIKPKEKYPRNEERSMDPITLEDVQHVGGINIRSIIKRQRNRPRNLTIVDIESCACSQKEPVRQSNVKKTCLGRVCCGLLTVSDAPEFWSRDVGRRGAGRVATRDVPRGCHDRGREDRC